jgi:hypothetical protein
MHSGMRTGLVGGAGQGSFALRMECRLRGAARETKIQHRPAERLVGMRSVREGPEDVQKFV